MLLSVIAAFYDSPTLGTLSQREGGSHSNGAAVELFEEKKKKTFVQTCLGTRKLSLKGAMHLFILSKQKLCIFDC